MFSTSVCILLGFATLFGTRLSLVASTPTLGSFPNTTQQPIETRRSDYLYTPGVGAHKVHIRLTTWNMARRICNDEGGHLAIINSVSEAKIIGELLYESGSDRGYIGAHDLYGEDDFVTIHGDSLAKAGFDEWRETQPDNHRNSDHCVEISKYGKLNDEVCTTPLAFVCELPLVECSVPQSLGREKFTVAPESGTRVTESEPSENTESHYNQVDVACAPALGSFSNTAQQPIETRRSDYRYTPGIGAHKVHIRLTTWNMARRICNDEGGHLAIINSVSEANIIGKLLNESGSQRGYIGAHDLYGENDFVTIHGDSLAKAGFDEWRETQPDNHRNSDHCVEISKYGKLNDEVCTAPLAFVCELPLVECSVPQSLGREKFTVAPESGTRVTESEPSENTESHYNQVDAACGPALGSFSNTAQQPIETRRSDYRYTLGIGAHKVHIRLTTWNMARRICNDEGGHLAIINSVSEANIIGKLLNESGSQRGYIGAHDLYGEDDFVTIHGDSLAKDGFDEWRAGEPNNKSKDGKDEDCVEIHPDGKLNDVPCDYRIRFICELPYIQEANRAPEVGVIQIGPN